MMERMDTLEHLIRARNNSEGLSKDETVATTTQEDLSSTSISLVEQRFEGQSSNHLNQDADFTICQHASQFSSWTAILNLPIVHGYLKSYPPAKMPSFEDDCTPEPSLIGSPNLSSEHIMGLMNSYLVNVYSKSPILDQNWLRECVERVAKEGLSRSTESCLVCAVLALGSISKSDDPLAVGSTYDGVAQKEHAIYYQCALSLFGLAIMGLDWTNVQAILLMGMYNMWSMRIQKAAILYHEAAVKCNTILESMPTSALPKSPVSESLMQCIFWACLKAECELVEEMKIDTSGLDRAVLSDTIPSPPQSSVVLNMTLSNADSVDADIEKAWLYYLTEVAFRRLLNRVYCVHLSIDSCQSNLPEYIRAMSELGYQAEQCSAPESIKHPLNDIPADAAGSEELQSHIRNRYLDVKFNIYYPVVKHVLLWDELPMQYLHYFVTGVDLIISRVLSYNIDFHHHGTRQNIGHMFSSAVILVVLRNQTVVQKHKLYPARAFEAIAKVKRYMLRWAGCCRFAWKALNVIEEIQASSGEGVPGSRPRAIETSQGSRECVFWT